MADAVSRLQAKLTRVVVPPYLRVKRGHVEDVSGYTYDRRGGIRRVVPRTRVVARVIPARVEEPPRAAPEGYYASTFPRPKRRLFGTEMHEHLDRVLHGEEPIDSQVLLEAIADHKITYADDQGMGGTPASPESQQILTWAIDRAPRSTQTLYRAGGAPGGYDWDPEAHKPRYKIKAGDPVSFGVRSATDSVYRATPFGELIYVIPPGIRAIDTREAYRQLSGAGIEGAYPEEHEYLISGADYVVDHVEQDVPVEGFGKDVTRTLVYLRPAPKKQVRSPGPSREQVEKAANKAMAEGRAPDVPADDKTAARLMTVTQERIAKEDYGRFLSMTDSELLDAAWGRDINLRPGEGNWAAQRVRYSRDGIVPDQSSWAGVPYADVRLAAGDTGARISIAKTWAREFRKGEIDRVNPMVRVAIQKGANALYTNPRTKRLAERLHPTVFAATKRVMASNDADRDSPPQAEYWSETHAIVAYDSSRSIGYGPENMKMAAPHPGVYVIDGSWDSVLLHEFGHQVWFDALGKRGDRESQATQVEFKFAWRNAADAVTNKFAPDSISGYAMRNEKEGFAEAFAIVTDPQFDPRDWRSVPGSNLLDIVAYWLQNHEGVEFRGTKIAKTRLGYRWEPRPPRGGWKDRRQFIDTLPLVRRSGDFTAESRVSEVHSEIAWGDRMNDLSDADADRAYLRAAAYYYGLGSEWITMPQPKPLLHEYHGLTNTVAVVNEAYATLAMDGDAALERDLPGLAPVLRKMAEAHGMYVPPAPDEPPPVPTPGPTPHFTSVKEAADYVTKRYGYGDFTGIAEEHLAKVQDVVEAVDQMVAKYPQIMSDPKWRFRGIGTDKSPGAPPNAVHWLGGAWAITRNYSHSPGSDEDASGPYIYLNADAFAEGSGLLGLIGFTVAGENDVRTSMIHEMGHVVAMTSGRTGEESVYRALRSTQSEVYPYKSHGMSPAKMLMRDVSMYAQGSTNETFAELFALLNTEELKKRKAASQARIRKWQRLMNEQMAYFGEVGPDSKPLWERVL